MSDQDGQEASPLLIPRGKHLCRCSKCIEKHWEDADGVEHQGRLFARDQTVEKHRLADNVQAQATTANAILLATISPFRNEDSLPVRPDSQGREELRPMTTVEADVKDSEASGIDSQCERPHLTSSCTRTRFLLKVKATLTSLENSSRRPARYVYTILSPTSAYTVWQHDCKTRLRLLASIQSNLDTNRKLIPNTGFSLYFSHVTSDVKISISDPVPEPTGSKGDNAMYLGIRNKLEYVDRSLENLEPIGDKDLDSRRAMLLEVAKANLSLLNNMRDDAWSDFLMARLLDSSEGVGPVHVKREDSKSTQSF